ncbi:MAG: aromatic ring-hydroxylating dioxygenase subunit alpha [Aestuariivirga sp.]|uniref:aromatic ring-hydroxylating oxygenase subunit alpha n=1 Tax=Aestuariivirga sp. TaxID=2650926 RepID=UPI0025C588EF|nr:aromatic ring-hydroxylating dioxygenase subunit alpha [Aestuariivirga sp.]MCA3562131.1 aromatic ring-hydroxylating dioxygenase subunit alpha [Aestuariivirga sp.]
MTGLPYDTIAIPNGWDRGGLPAWTYHSQALFDLERDQLFLTHWQVVGHVGNIPAAGDWLSFDMLGERAVIMRGQDGVVRAFHNLCRHRGARVVDGSKGHCKGAIVCPFHGWVYNLDGSLRGAARPSSFGELKREDFGLKPIEMEMFQGFIFIRFKPGPQPSVSELLAPYETDFAAYGLEKLLPARNLDWTAELPVNWKSVRDVDNEGYHVALAHPGLQELYGRTYRDLHLKDGLSVSIGWFDEGAARGWSVKNYARISPPRPDLPLHLQKAWTYYGLFPNAVFAVTPEGAQFYQEIPLGPGRTRLSGRMYRWPNESRATRLARYLAFRIDRFTSAEDQQLSIWSNESMKSEAFEGFHLSDLEYGLRRHHDGLRKLMPVMTLPAEPSDRPLPRANEELICQSTASF